MGNKNGFDPSITSGVQSFSHLGTWATVCYWGSALERYSIGECVFFQNQYEEFWLGTIERDCFVFIYEKPLGTVIEGLSFLNPEYRMYQAHGEDDWFSQGELPF